MATIIDALLVTIGLDAKEFKKGSEDTNKALEDTKKRADTSARGITASQSKTQDAFRDTGSHATSAASAIEKGAARSHTAVRQLDTGITAASKSIGEAGKVMLAPFAELALGVGAAVLSIDGIKKAIGGAISQAGVDSAQGRAASMAGIPVEDYSSFGAAVQSVNGDKSAAEATLSNLAMQQQAASIGQISPQMMLLSQLGIKPNQNVIDIMGQLNQKFQGMSKAQATYTASLLGIDPGTTFLLEKTPAEYQAALKAGAADQITPEQQAAEGGISKSYANVLLALDNLSRDVTADAAPNLIALLDGIKSFVKWLDNQGASWFSQHFSNKALTGDATAVWDDVQTLVGGARGVRNNNPLNLKFANQPGAHADNGGFAVFPTMRDGITADYHQLMLDQGRGANTVRKLVYGWDTSPGDNREAYIQTVLKQLQRAGISGVTDSTPIDLSNKTLAQAVISGMSIAEGNGSIWSYGNKPGAALPTSVTNVLTALRSNTSASYSGGGVHHHGATEINVTVHTTGGDPHQIASVVKRELQKAGRHTANAAGGVMQ